MRRRVDDLLDYSDQSDHLDQALNHDIIIVVEEFVFEVILVPGELVSLPSFVFDEGAFEWSVGQTASARINSNGSGAAKSVFVIFTVLVGAIDLGHNSLRD